MVLNLGDMSYKTTLFHQKWNFLEKGVKTWYNQPLQTNKLLYKPSDYALYFEKFSIQPLDLGIVPRFILCHTEGVLHREHNHRGETN